MFDTFGSQALQERVESGNGEGDREPADNPARSRDLARLHELTGPHLAYRGAPIQQALAHMTPDDRAEVIAILGRIGDPPEGATDDDVT